MEWIVAKEHPPKQGQKNLICSGVDGGVYKPTSVQVNDEGEVFMIVSGQKRFVHAYLIYPDAPKPKRATHKTARRTTKKDHLKWPLNMFADIDREYFRGCIFFNETPEKFDENWDEVSQTITEREKLFVEEHYKNNRRYQEIATRYNLSRERVRQILNKAIRKLRHKSRITVLIGKKQKTVENADEYVQEKVGILDEDIAFCEPDLSVRAFNALKRNGINTKRELALLTKDQVMDMRNVGKVTCEEIVKHIEKIHNQIFAKNKEV